MTTTILVYGYFENSTDLDGETSLADVTVDLWSVAKADLTKSQVVTTQPATEIGNGIYAYRLASADLATYEYTGTFETASSDVVSKMVPVLRINTVDTYTTQLGYLDQALSTTETNIRGADGDTLETLSDQLDAAGTLANQTTILARIGAFTGTGVNTILGFLKALASKAATLPSDIGGTFSPTTDSVEALRDYMASSASITPVTYIDGDTINIIRGDVFAESMDDTGVTDDFVTVDFSVKRRESDSDDNAIIRIRKNASGLNDGLTRLNGAAVSAGDASLASLSISGGTVTWSIDESVTDDLIIADGLVYDIQEIDADGPHTRVEGTCNIKADVTRLIV